MSAPRRVRRRPWLPTKGELALAVLFTPIVLAVFVYRSGRRLGVEVSPSEVAVIQDELRDQLVAVDRPGVHIALPNERVHRIDKSPKELVMEGDRYSGAKQVPYLLARDREGSSFSFDRVVLQYAVTPEAAADVFADVGDDPADVAELARTFARAFLRDELGRVRAEALVDPEVLRACLDAAQERLNERLGPLGVDVLQVTASKPVFARQYEQVIERRKVGSQELEHLAGKFELLRAREEARLAAVEETKQLELDLLARQMERQKFEAERTADRVRRAADFAFNKKVEEGRREAYRLTKDAEARELRYRGEHEAFLAETRALEAAGEAVIRQALIERLKTVELDVVPVPAKDEADGRRASYAEAGA